MFLRCKVRGKDGKQHRYWSVVENARVGGGRVVQRHVLYLGEINDTQEAAWRRSIAVIEDGAAQPRTLSLFPEDRCEGLLADASIVRVKLSELRLRRPRQWGACWLALLLWRELQLDLFWSKRLGSSRKGTRWDQVLFVLAAYRLLAPGSEWRLHREWFQRSALADLLGEDAGVAEIHKLYRCHDRLLVHKQAVFDHLTRRWRDLFNISYDVLLYDLTSTYFEADPPFPEGDKGRVGAARGGPPREPRGRPANALSGGHAEGPLDAFGKASRHQAVATGATRCTGQAIGARGRALRLGAKPRPRRQGAGDAAAAVEAVVDAAETALDDGALARGATDETRRRARAVPHRLAPGHDRDRRRRRHVQLSARRASPPAATRGSE